MNDYEKNDLIVILLGIIGALLFVVVYLPKQDPDLLLTALFIYMACFALFALAYRRIYKKWTHRYFLWDLNGKLFDAYEFDYEIEYPNFESNEKPPTLYTLYRLITAIYLGLPDYREDLEFAIEKARQNTDLSYDEFESQYKSKTASDSDKIII